VKRVADKFKKYRYRRDGETSFQQAEVDRMREKYGRKRLPKVLEDPDTPEPVVKVQRTVVSTWRFLLTHSYLSEYHAIMCVCGSVILLYYIR